MTKEQTPIPHTGESHMSAETADMLSKQRSMKEKSVQKNYPKEDKRNTVREEHTNGSTPSNRL